MVIKMICIDCLNPCEAIGCMGMALCCDCSNFVFRNQKRSLCKFCKMFYKPFEVIPKELDSKKIWMALR